MIRTNRFWKFFLITLVSLSLVTLAMVGYIVSDLSPAHQTLLIQIFQTEIYPIILLVFILIATLWVVGDIVYNRYIRPIKQMAAEAEIIYSANPSHRLHLSGSKDIQTLVRVINDFADMFENLDREIKIQILSARRETETERNLLAAVMDQIPQGVIICNTQGQILFYNHLGKSIFSNPSPGKNSTDISLGRSIFNFIAEEQIQRALSRQVDTGKDPGFTIQSGDHRLYCVTPSRVMHTRAMDPTGFMLLFQQLSQAQAHPFMAPHDPAILFQRLKQTLSASPSGFQLEIHKPAGPALVEMDLHLMVRAIRLLMESLAGLTRTDRLSITARQGDTHLDLEIRWQGRAVNALEINQAQGVADAVALVRLTRGDWQMERRDDHRISSVSISLPLAGNREAQPPSQKNIYLAGSRPEFYDFDLFDAQVVQGDQPLKKMAFTVMDTETTGLNPDQGDEILSIAALRIVNQRIVFTDSFEELVDPQRHIPLESYKIHGIHPDMVKGKETLKTVLPRFKQFVGTSILVGHNIAFDLKMFKVKEWDTGIRFKNPALDTLLLSALLHPAHDDHAMEGIARRLGVDIVGRHTALGDAVATAKIFLKLIPLLEDNGIHTLDEALAASRKTYYARLKY